MKTTTARAWLPALLRRTARAPEDWFSGRKTSPSPALAEKSGALENLRDSWKGWREVAAAHPASYDLFFCKRARKEKKGGEERRGVGNSADSPTTKRTFRVNYETLRDYTLLSLGRHNGLQREREREKGDSQCAHGHIPGDGKASPLTGVSCPPYRLHPNPVH